ncbi:MAG: AraC family transcriptional regulator [Chitinophagaceae bacterium]|nr:MAG: AraC family transcriptional regulator [Chitinophagaceae bacterium]
MLFSFSLKSSILLIFGVHGVVFSFLLLAKGIDRNDKSNLWLSLFIFLCTLYICPFLFGYAGWYGQQPYRDILFYIPFQQLFLIPPALYFYFRTLLDKSFVFSRRHLVHFLPALAYLIYSGIVFAADRLFLHEPYFYADGQDKDFSTWYQLTGFLSLAGYLLLSLATYRKYKRISYDIISFADSVMFRWAQKFLLSLMLLLSLRLLFFILNPEWDQFGKKFWYYSCFSILFYYISVSGLLNSVRSSTSFLDHAAGNSRTASFPETDQSAPAADESIDQAPDAGKADEPLILQVPVPGAGITVDHTSPAAIHVAENAVKIPDLEIWKLRIETLMETEKPFENPELTLPQFCLYLDIPLKKASQLINQGFNMNFNDFINHYRTRAVIGRMNEGEHNLQTLLGIAFESGFNSKSTFNRAFKRYTSMTPKEYLKKNGLK